MPGKNEEVTIEVKPYESSGSAASSSIERTYMIHVPNRRHEESQEPFPLIIVMHGGGATARYAIRDTGFTRLADAFGFLCVFPEGLRANMLEPPLMVRNAQTWNDGSGRFFSGENDVDDVSFIDAVIADLDARFEVDLRRIYMTGFSNGASMTFRYAVERPNVLAAIAPVAGGFWVEPPYAKLHVPTIYITGTDDKYNPMESKPGPQDEPRAWDNPRISANETVRRWANVLGCSTNSTVIKDQPPLFISKLECDQSDCEFLFVTIKDMGHVWPGGHKPLPEERVGKYDNSVYATSLVWEFFVLHSRNNSAVSKR